MKKVYSFGLFASLSALFSVSAHAVSPSEVVGTYSITSALQPGVENIVELKADGSEIFEENVSGEILKCTGAYEFKAAEERILSELSCDNGLKFTQIVALKGLTVSDLRKGAEAQAASSLFGIDDFFAISIQKTK